MCERSIEVAAIQQIVHLQAHWPARIDLAGRPPTTFDALVEHLRPAFPGVDDAAAAALATFCRLYAGSVLLQDRVLDGDVPRAKIGVTALTVSALQYEAYRVLHGLFPPEARFWDRFRTCLAAHVRAFLVEDEFRAGRPLAELTEERAIELAIGKHALAKTIVAGLVEASGREELLAPVGAAVDAVAVAFQMHDDLEDWRLDLATRSPSLLLARLPPSLTGPVASEADWPRVVDRLARHVYRGGHASHVLRVARRYLAAVDLAAIAGTGWAAVVRCLRDRCDRMLAVIDEAGAGSAPSQRRA